MLLSSLSNYCQWLNPSLTANNAFWARRTDAIGQRELMLEKLRKSKPNSSELC